MTSKERVLTTLARQEPDRVPVNYYGNADIDRRLKAHFGTQNLAEAPGVDFRLLWYRSPQLRFRRPGLQSLWHLYPYCLG